MFKPPHFINISSIKKKLSGESGDCYSDQEESDKADRLLSEEEEEEQEELEEEQEDLDGGQEELDGGQEELEEEQEIEVVQEGENECEDVTRETDPMTPGRL